MANGYLLAAPDRVVKEIETILANHDIVCELDRQEECDAYQTKGELTVLTCSSASASIDLAIEERKGRKGADVVLIPESGTLFRRNRNSEDLAEYIAKILCEHGATDTPHARCEDLE